MNTARDSSAGGYDTLIRVLAGEMSAVLWATDDAFRITSCLGPALSKRGLGPDEGTGMTIAEFFQLADADAPLLAAHRHALHGQPISCDVSWGDESYHAFVAPLRDADARIVGCTGFARQLTPRDREAEELYRLFNLSLQMLCIAGTDGYFKRVNPAFEKTLGYAPDELLNRPFVDYVHPDDRESTLRELEKLARGQPSLHFENRYRCKDGSYRWLTWTSVPQDEEGLLYATALDITERKRAEGLFRALLESAPDAVVVVDGGGHIVLLNRMAEQLFQYTRDELLGQSIETLIPERFRDQHLKNRSRFLTQPQLQAMGGSGCVCARRKDETEFPVEVRLSPVEIEGARLVFSAVRDVSQREQLARSMRDREIQLLAAERIQQHFLPQSAPQVPGLDVAGTVLPAEYAGGDHFDYLEMSDGSLGVVVGDVSGHGFSSALLMASTHELLRAGAGLHDDIGAILGHANQALARQVEHGSFVTAIFVRVEMPGGKLTYSNAGHPSGLVFDATGQVKACLESASLPLALFPDAEFPLCGPVQLVPGDLVLLLTDGVLEARSPAGELFETDRVVATVRPVLHCPAEHIVNKLCDAVRAFSEDAKLQDDVTVVAIKLTNRN